MTARWVRDYVPKWQRRAVGRLIRRRSFREAARCYAAWRWAIHEETQCPHA